MRNLIVSLVLLLPLSLFAKAIPCQGYFINDTNDSIACTFYVPIDRDVLKPVYLEVQKKIKCIETLSGKTHVLTCKGIKRYAFSYDETPYVFCRVNFGRKKDSQTFVHKIAGGYLTAFEYFSQDFVEMQYINYRPITGADRYRTQSVAIGVYVNYLLQAQGGPFAFVEGLNFKTAMSDYFSDYPELADKIKKGIYSKKMMGEIVNDYNQHKLSNQ